MEKYDVMMSQYPVDPAQAEDFMLLMSLALDGRLDEAEERRFQRYLVEHPQLAAQWQSWQALDGELHATPAALPPADFVGVVAMRIEHAERRRRLWMGTAVGVAAVLLWGTALVALVGAGAFVLLNQSALLSDLVRLLAYSSAAIASWFNSLLQSLDALASAPQVRNFGVAYLAVTAAILAGWFQLLRRSTRVPEVASAG